MTVPDFAARPQLTPVREALFELRAEGLLAQQPRRGFVVLPVTGRDLTDVSNVQAHIGGELAARAAANISDEQLRGLEKIQSELENAYADDDDGGRAVRLNHDFHRAINVAADSPKLAQLMSQITRYAPESVFPTIAGWPRTGRSNTIGGYWPHWSSATKTVLAQRCPSTSPRVRHR